MTKVSGWGRRAWGLARLSGRAALRAAQTFFLSASLTYAASIAYWALLSLLPFSLLALSILGSITVDEGVRDQVLDFVFQYFPRQFDFLTGQLDALRTTPARLGVAGSLFLAWSALGFFGAITTAVNYAWGVAEPRSFLGHRLFSFLMLAVAGVTLVVALLLMTASQVVGATWFAGVLARFPALAVLGGVALRNATTALFVVVVGLVFYYVPNVKMRLRDVWIGALVTGILWSVTLRIFSWYVSDLERFESIHGSLAAAVVFLTSVYVQSVILLYGVQFTAAYARLLHGPPEPLPETTPAQSPH